ncbi:hypothetical protein DCAR_0205790 [Daucus carota subsp. sativus]|uniref:PGG domain-containing protein n=1 Tax=Daucus carota subsp. sativus TaxID=79200 RepID=A0AAF0WEI4_DAUCS|nr:hypothetical protein DCAR_0205790 [Daucus carota subsp. sativus]
MDLDTLFDAAMAGDAAATAELEIEADRLYRFEETILHLQSEKGNTERVKFILRKFAHKNLLAKLSRYKHTALHLAIYEGQTEVAEVLIDAACDLPPPSDDDHNPKLTSFQAFVRQGDKDMDTALHAAVLRGNATIVKRLVEADPTDTHIQNNDGKTPMYIAVENGLNHIAEIISTTCKAPSLDGPDGSTVVLFKDSSGKSPGGTLFKIMDRYAFFVAAIAGDAYAIAKLETQADILNRGEETTNAKRVRVILREFAKKNLLAKLTSEKQTTLHLAAIYGHTELAEILIDAASYLHPSDNDNTQEDPTTSFQAFLRQSDLNEDTALHAAVKKGNLAIVKLLVEADPSDTHIQNDDGKTPMYIAVEQGLNSIAEVISTTCFAPSLLGPDCSTVVRDKNFDQAESPGGSLYKIMHKDALYAAAIAGDADAIAALEMHADKLDKYEETILHTESENGSKEEGTAVIKLIIKAVKHANKHGTPDERSKRLMQFFTKTDEKRRMILELAVEEDHLDVVQLILAKNPAYHWPHRYPELIGIMPLIYRAMDMDKENNAMVNLLTRVYQNGVQSSKTANVHKMISAIDSRKEEYVLSLLNNRGVQDLVTFHDILGWTILHHAVYYEHNSIIGIIIEAQKTYGHGFRYPDRISTPFHVAVQKGYVSTMKLLLRLWPSSSSAYIDVDRNGRNILHLAALQSGKEMIRCILKYCPQMYKEFVNKKDDDGNTPLHLLICGGCFIPEFLKYQGLDIRIENEKRWIPRDMLYFQDQIVEDQVQIRIALDGIETDPTGDGKFSRFVLPSRRMRKDVILDRQAKLMIHEKYTGIKEDPDVIANCFADAIAGDPISKAVLRMKAYKLNELGETILHVESMKGEIENVRFIVSEFANKSLLGKLDRSKQTALHLAAQHGHTQVVEALIDAARLLPNDAHNQVTFLQDFIRQADVQNGNTTLHLAVVNDNVAIVKLLVEADSNDSHVRNHEGKTPIYIAAENGYKNIVKVICTACTALSLDGPSTGKTTALHSLMQNIDQEGTEGESDVIGMMVDAAKRWSSAQNASTADFEALFNRTDELGRTVLQIAVERKDVNAVRLILKEDPAYQPGGEMKRNGLMRLICKAIDDECSDDIITSLSQTYKAGIIHHDPKDVLALIRAIQDLDKDVVLSLLGKAQILATFTEDNGWTPLHYAVYYEFDVILDAMIKAQKDVGYPFVYKDMETTPFYVAIERGYTSTLVRLMELWPTLSSDECSPYTLVTQDSQNMLHMAAVARARATENRKDVADAIDNRKVFADSRKEMVQMELWPASSSDAYSPYTLIPQDGKNIHMAAAAHAAENRKVVAHVVDIVDSKKAAADNRKEMVQSVLKYCPNKYKDKILKQKDKNGDTPLHLLISHGCFIPALLKHEGLDTMARNKRDFTPRDMLYVEDATVVDQVHIKIALDEVLTSKSGWKLWGRRTEKKEDIWRCNKTPPSKRKEKDVKFEGEKKILEKQRTKDRKTYKMRTNTQILVTALTTTVTFTVGFTMPGGLHQSGEDDEGLVILSRKTAFNIFMVSDALALLMSTSSLFFYFLESMNEDLHQVSLLNASSTVLNILSISAMMVTFIAGTYVVLSGTPLLAIAICIIGSLFFLLILILWIMKIVFDRYKRNKD